MGPEQCLLAYAAAFEETYLDDDWSRLDQYFAKDATYEVIGGPFSCKLEGPEAIFRGLKKSIDGLDRRCDSRRIEVTKGPEISGNRVEIDWQVTYERGDAPPVTLVGRSIGTVVDDRITTLVDEYSDSEMEKTANWMSKHGQGLDGSYV